MKDWVKQIIVLLAALMVILLIDEYVREGYLFKVEDIFNQNITHETIILSFAAFIALAHAVNLLKSCKGFGRENYFKGDETSNKICHIRKGKNNFYICGSGERDGEKTKRGERKNVQESVNTERRINTSQNITVNANKKLLPNLVADAFYADIRNQRMHSIFMKKLRLLIPSLQLLYGVSKLSKSYWGILTSCSFFAKTVMLKFMQGWPVYLLMSPTSQRPKSLGAKLSE